MSDTERAWYDEAIRWGQTNLVEADPLRYDVDFWRRQWQRTKIQGVWWHRRVLPLGGAEPHLGSGHRPARSVRGDCRGGEG